MTTAPAAGSTGSTPGLTIEAGRLAYENTVLFEKLTLELRAGEWTSPVSYTHLTLPTSVIV